MAKKLPKAQMGKFIKGAIKSVAKEAKPVVNAVKPMVDISKKEIGNAVALSERARLKAHLESLSKKQTGGVSKINPRISNNNKVNASEMQKFQKITNDKMKVKPSIKVEPKKTMQQEVLNPTRNFAKKGGVVKSKKK
jgi:hypothetical protein